MNLRDKALRIASGLPKGDPTRRKILAALKNAEWKPPKINKTLAKAIATVGKRHFVTEVINASHTRGKDAARQIVMDAIGKAVTKGMQMRDLVDTQAPIKAWKDSLSDADLVQLLRWVEEAQEKNKSVEYRTTEDAWKNLF